MQERSIRIRGTGCMHAGQRRIWIPLASADKWRFTPVRRIRIADTECMHAGLMNGSILMEPAPASKLNTFLS